MNFKSTSSKSSKTPKNRNPLAIVARKKKAGKIKDRRQPRGGAKNISPDDLLDLTTQVLNIANIEINSLC